MSVHHPSLPIIFQVNVMAMQQIAHSGGQGAESDHVFRIWPCPLLSYHSAFNVTYWARMRLGHLSPSHQRLRPQSVRQRIFCRTPKPPRSSERGRDSRKRPLSPRYTLCIMVSRIGSALPHCVNSRQTNSTSSFWFTRALTFSTVKRYLHPDGDSATTVPPGRSCGNTSR